MSDRVIFNEIALNKREITHPVYGSFIVRRPTNKILSIIATEVTKSSNRDLQARDIITDPETGEKKKVPMFLTRSAKMKLLRELGEWTDDDETALLESEAAYRDVCIKLNNENFNGVHELMAGLKEVYEFIHTKAEDKGALEAVKSDINTLFPMRSSFEDFEDNDYPDAPDGKSYGAAKNSVEHALKDLEVVQYLDTLDTLYKQYALYLEGISAQTKMLLSRVRELEMFADTIEARADLAGRIAKVYHCTLTSSEQKPWRTLDECQDSPQSLVSWLLSEIEKLERIDETASEEDIKRRDRFNFLLPLGDMNVSSEDSDVQRISKTDGESLEKTD